MIIALISNLIAGLSGLVVFYIFSNNYGLFDFGIWMSILLLDGILGSFASLGLNAFNARYLPDFYSRDRPRFIQIIKYGFLLRLVAMVLTLIVLIVLRKYIFDEDFLHFIELHSILLSSFFLLSFLNKFFIQAVLETLPNQNGINYSKLSVYVIKILSILLVSYLGLPFVTAFRVILLCEIVLFIFSCALTIKVVRHESVSHTGRLLLSNSEELFFKNSLFLSFFGIFSVSLVEKIFSSKISLESLAIFGFYYSLVNMMVNYNPLMLVRSLLISRITSKIKSLHPQEISNSLCNVLIIALFLNSLLWFILILFSNLNYTYFDKYHIPLEIWSLLFAVTVIKLFNNFFALQFHFDENLGKLMYSNLFYLIQIILLPFMVDYYGLYGVFYSFLITQLGINILAVILSKNTLRDFFNLSLYLTLAILLFICFGVFIGNTIIIMIAILVHSLLFLFNANGFRKLFLITNR